MFVINISFSLKTFIAENNTLFIVFSCVLKFYCYGSSFTNYNHLEKSLCCGWYWTSFWG